VPTLHNEISIEAPPAAVIATLADVGALADYDPTVAGVEVTSARPTGVGASRKVTMADGRHWFEERMTVCEPAGPLAFELTACNFPIKALRHSYAVESADGSTTVAQEMTYTVKFGPAGVLLDRLALRRGFDAGVKEFLAGLKGHLERDA
jgi:ribosome-associated toxin RatA of RatAB toxin-antitoxin module